VQSLLPFEGDLRTLHTDIYTSTYHTTATMSNNPYLLTLPQLLSAKKKIGRVAAFHDPQKNSFAGFTGKLISSHHISTHLISPYLITSRLISPHLISSYIISSYLILSHLISSYLISSYTISYHLISSHLISILPNFRCEHGYNMAFEKTRRDVGNFFRAEETIQAEDASNAENQVPEQKSENTAATSSRKIIGIIINIFLHPRCSCCSS
jgi:hypothetical protein